MTWHTHTHTECTADLAGIRARIRLYTDGFGAELHRGRELLAWAFEFPSEAAARDWCEGHAKVYAEAKR